MDKQKFHSQTYFILCGLIAFMLPVYIHFVPVFIALLFLNWLLEGQFSEKIQKIKKNKTSWLFIGFYFIFLLGMFWTDNINSGWFDLEVKLSLLVFPLILSSKSLFTSVYLKKILGGFVIGCFVVSSVCILTAQHNLFTTDDKQFIISNISKVLHPSYFAMYLSFGIVILMYFLKDGKTLCLSQFIKVFLIIFFSVTIILLAAKAGIVILALILFSYVVFLLLKKKKILHSLIFLALSASCFFFVLKFFPHSKERIVGAFNVLSHTENIHTQDSESNAVRLLVWQASASVIKEKFLIGVGTGDVKDALQKKYQEKEMTGALQKGLNAHSQYLQTFIALGVAGEFFLLMIFFIPFIAAWKMGNYLYCIFLIILALNFLVESMLEVQAGVMFYAFFNSLLLFSDGEKR